ncbi:MAG: hypothetical protein JST30_00585 [Armatimonadetes bacterium]|nr:hypothetical protein [Armatimonadota bacterium]
MRRRSVFRFWLLSTLGLFIGVVAPSVCAVACGQGFCAALAPIERKASCCHPKSDPDKCPKCGAQAEITAKKGQSVLVAKAVDGPIDPLAVLPPPLPVVQTGRVPIRTVVRHVSLRAPPDPSVGPESPRAPPIPVV